MFGAGLPIPRFADRRSPGIVETSSRPGRPVRRPNHNAGRTSGSNDFIEIAREVTYAMPILTASNRRIPEDCSVPVSVSRVNSESPDRKGIEMNLALYVMTRLCEPKGVTGRNE